MPSSFVWLTVADAAWANRFDGSSTSGHVVMAAHPNILYGESSTVSVLAWNSRKIRRVVGSSLGAECAAFSTGLEHADMSGSYCTQPDIRFVLPPRCWRKDGKLVNDNCCHTKNDDEQASLTFFLYLLECVKMRNIATPWRTASRTSTRR